MKKLKSVVSKMAKNSANLALRRDTNSTTCAAVFQPKVPSSLDKLKKHND